MSNFSEELLNEVWDKGIILDGWPPNEYRLDAAGAMMVKNHRELMIFMIGKLIMFIRRKNSGTMAQPERGYEYRKGMKYQTMYADNRILHESDRSLLPEGATIIKSVYESTYEQISVIYHTFIETCKMCGVSTLEYFEEFFKAIMLGRTDYENMLPMTIGIKK